MPATLSVKECLAFGWNTFKARPWIFVQAFLIVAGVLILESIVEAPLRPGEGSALALIASLISAIVSAFIGMGLISFALKAHDDLTGVTLRHLWVPHLFLKYFVLNLLLTIILIPAYILLIIPGIFLSACLLFAPYFVVAEEVGPIDAIKKSWALTRGNRWKIVLLGAAVIGLSILGMLALIVGLLIAAPVALLAIAHAFRTLERAQVASVS